MATVEAVPDPVYNITGLTQHQVDLLYELLNSRVHYSLSDAIGITSALGNAGAESRGLVTFSGEFPILK